MKYQGFPDSYDASNQTLSMQFIDKQSNKSIQVHNVWGLYNPFPNITETYYRDTLFGEEYKEADTILVMGDTNSRDAPLHNNP